MKIIDTRRARALRAGAGLSFAAAGLVTLAACGSGDSSAAGSAPDDSGMTVTVRDVGGTSVLANSSGATLYVSDQEHGKVLCSSSSCTEIWAPLKLTAGQKPTAAGDVGDELGTVKRSDGSTQVTYDDRPLYTFALDHGTGQLGGDGAQDSFDGTAFTWHAATPDGEKSDSGGSGDSGSGGYGGY